ncbi:hypothetical protein [Nocardia heshunensis]
MIPTEFDPEDLDPEEEVRYVLECLSNPSEPEDVTRMLEILQRYPIADERVAAGLSPLLTDRTPCTFSAPYLYGETRWLAAHALAAVNRTLGREEAIPMSKFPEPRSADEIDSLLWDAGIETAGSSYLEKFAKLRDLGALPIMRPDLGT